MPSLTWAVVEDPADDDILAVRRRLIQSNLAASSIGDSRDLAVLVRDAGGQVVAGVTGTVWGSCLEIGFVWVHDAWRGQGVGRRLMDVMEAEARQRGCRVISLDTYTFQAPDFYRKLGYQEFGRVGGYPDGVEKVFMRKELA